MTRIPSPGANRNLLFSNTTRMLTLQTLLLGFIQIIQLLPGGENILKLNTEWAVSLFPAFAEPNVNTALMAFHDVNTKAMALVLAVALSVLGLAIRAWRHGDRSISPWAVGLLVVLSGSMIVSSGGTTIWFVALNVFSGYSEQFDDEFTPPWWSRLPIVRSIIR